MLVSRCPGLSPLVSWPCVMADSASRACDAARELASDSVRGRLRVDVLRPTPAFGRRSTLINLGNAKARRWPNAKPSRGLKGDSADADEDVIQVETRRHCHPKWKRRPAADAETGDAIGPSSYDRGRFRGQVESAEALMAFRLMYEAVRLRVATCPRIPAVQGDSLEKGLPVVIRLSPRGAMVPCLR